MIGSPLYAYWPRNTYEMTLIGVNFSLTFCDWIAAVIGQMHCSRISQMQ